jgi:hypothetical protein
MRLRKNITSPENIKVLNVFKSIIKDTREILNTPKEKMHIEKIYDCNCDGSF